MNSPACAWAHRVGRSGILRRCLRNPCAPTLRRSAGLIPWRSPGGSPSMTRQSRLRWRLWSSGRDRHAILRRPLPRRKSEVEILSLMDTCLLVPNPEANGASDCGYYVLKSCGTARCEQRRKGRYPLEVFDIHQQPQLAESVQIVAIPRLIKVLPAPPAKVYWRHVKGGAGAAGLGSGKL